MVSLLRFWVVCLVRWRVVSLLRWGGGHFAPVLGGHFDRFFQFDEGYKLFFCSDHGSIVAKGNGKKIEKYLREKFAKRACLIEGKTSVEFQNFPQMKIPFVENKLLVLAEGRTMFDNLNYIEISHGGITVDEIVVPFIEVSKWLATIDP